LAAAWSSRFVFGVYQVDGVVILQNWGQILQVQLKRDRQFIDRIRDNDILFDAGRADVIFEITAGEQIRISDRTVKFIGIRALLLCVLTIPFFLSSSALVEASLMLAVVSSKLTIV
jgi:hypothetical protein